MKLIALLLASVFFSGCVSLNTVSLTSIPSQRQKPINASVEKFMVLGFNFDNDYVDVLTDRLRAQCPNGQITGVLTKDEDTNYFLYFFWKKNVSAQAYCVQYKPVSKLNNSPTNKRRPSDEGEQGLVEGEVSETN